jgi:chromosome segregation ATPase
LQALQSKFTESEETVISLKAELESVNEKLSQLSVSGEDGTKDGEAIESARAEHAAELEKLTSAHADELQSLQARLEEAESRRKELEEKSHKELEEAKQFASASGDSETAAALEELKESHKAQLDAIEKELADHKAAASAFEEQINTLKSELESQKAGQEEKALALDSLERELKGRDQVIDNLNNEFQKLSTSKDQELALAKAAAESTGTEHSQQLQDLREALESAKSATQGDHEKAISELKAAHEAELKSVQEKFEASEKALADYRTALEEGKASAQEDAIKEIDALRHKVELLETQLSTGSVEIKALQHEVQAKQAQAEELYSSLKDVEAQFKAKDAQQDNKLKEQDSKMKALEDKAAEATRLLDEQTAQAAIVSKKHAEELQALKAEHAAELERVQQEASGSHEGDLNALQLKHDDLVSKNKELESTHATRVESLEAELKSTLERHAGDIAAHTESHEKQTSELQKQFGETEAKLQAELEALQASSKAEQESHAKQLAELQKGFEETKTKLQNELQAVQASKAADADAEHGKAIEELLTLQEAKVAGVKDQLEASHNAKIVELQKTHDAALASVNEQLAQAKAAVQDTSVLDGLKATIAELEQKLTASEKTHATAQDTAVSASRELQEKHAAEIARIQAAHVELGKKHDAAITQIEELQKSAATSSNSKSELDAAQKQLSQYREELEILKTKHTNSSEELEEYKANAKIMEEKLVAGERDLGEQIDKNMQLLNQLGDVDAAISGSRRRVRELEAELAALKASNDKSSSSGLEASKWASAEEGEEKAEGGGPASEGEDLDPGSSIEGTVGDPRLKSSYSSYLPVFHPFR